VTVENVSGDKLESTASEKEENWSENLKQNSSEVNCALGVGKCP